ncbi:hypothetical protein ABBQ38_003323 [Trebouxia sp. C0009 RCD-2024]
MPDVERKSKQRLQAQLARVAQAVHSLDPTSLQTVVASLTELGQVGSRFPFSLISRVVRVCSTGASADAERIAHNLCICTTSVYTACQAVQEEQQAQRHLLGETLKVVTDTVQQAAAERQQKAEVNAFHEELLALVQSEPHMLEFAVKSALTGDPVILYRAIHAHQKTQIQALDKRLQEGQDQAAAAASQLVTERQNAQQLQLDHEQALLEQKKKTQAAVARAEEQTSLCNTLQQSLQEAVVNNQKLLETTQGVQQLSESRDAVLSDAVQRETAAVRKSEQDAREVSRLAMLKLQAAEQEVTQLTAQLATQAVAASKEVGAAKSQAQLLVEELALQKRALNKLQDDLQAGQKKHQNQLTRMRQSKFPAAQAESIATLQRELTVAKTDATTAKEAAKESAAAAAQAEDRLKQLSGQQTEAVERADRLQAEVARLRNTGGDHCSETAEADSAGVSESEREGRGRAASKAASPQGSAKATASSTHVGECEWCHEGNHELKNCPLVNLLQEDAVALPKESKEQAWQQVQAATPKPPKQQASEGRQQGKGKGKKRDKRGGKGQAPAGRAVTSSGNPSSRHQNSSGGSASLQTPPTSPAGHAQLGPRPASPSPSPSSHDPSSSAAQHTAPRPALPHNQGRASSNAWSRLKGPAATTAPGPSPASSSNEPGGN